MSEAAILRLASDETARGRPYVERAERTDAWHDELALAAWYGLAQPMWRAIGGPGLRARRVVAQARALDQPLRQIDDDGLKALARGLRVELRRTRFDAASVARCFAVVREAGARVCGKRHYDCQLHAGWLLLQGSLAEMATGEGKTYAATLPACAAALAGLPVHIVTVNDYLAARDAETMAPLYAFFGLRCGAIVHGQSRLERREIYSRDVVYCSNKELAFDYLRDRTALGDRASPLHLSLDMLAGAGRDRADPATVLRGRGLAIVDEADSVFIDEARTPLILSATRDRSRRETLTDWARRLAPLLDEGPDYEVERALMRVRLGQALRESLDEDDGEFRAAGPLDHPLPGATGRERAEALTQALSALHLFHRDRHYVVVDGKVQIVDESTGRVMPDRAWERGLHQAVEAKEGLEPSAERETLARITYQRFFRRYLWLAGMSGTATEVAGEIGRIYRLPVSPVPLNRPKRWCNAGARCLPGAAAKWMAVVDSVRRRAVESGQPVLVVTRTVEASEVLSLELARAGIAHVVLNAKQDSDEASIVGRAGQMGAVTVATNMAGRGTDIALGEGVIERGGLHVILTEYHDSSRIDRQLFGRAARQGDPGSGEAIVALDDELFTVHAPRLTRWLSGIACGHGRSARLALALLRQVAQRGAEARSRAIRMGSLRQDRRLASLLAFSGRGE